MTPFDAAYYGLSVNPAHKISQALESTLLNCAASGAGASFKLTDCHKLFAQGSYSLTSQRVTDAPPGFTYSNKLTVTGAQSNLGTDDVIHAFQPIEGYRVENLKLGSADCQPFVMCWIVKAGIDNQVVNA